MKPRRWQFLTVVVSFMLLFVVYSTANAQDVEQIRSNDLYVPYLAFNPVPPGQFQPLTECSVGFELSQPFPNGTSFEQIGDILGIRTVDIWNAEHNRSRFPEQVIDSVTKESPICWLGEDVYQTLYLEDADLEEPLNLYFPDGRGDYLTPVMMAGTTQACQTLSVVLTTAEGTWHGAPIVGALRRGFSQVIGKIVCNIATVPQGIWSRVAFAYPVATAATQIYQASTEGVLVPPTLLNEEGTAAVFYYAIDVDLLYPHCSMDAVLEADNMRTPIKRRLYMVGYEDVGCLFASEPFFEGQRALSLDLLNKNALMLTAYFEVYEEVYEKTPSFEEAQEIIAAWEADINRKEWPAPYWVPEKNPNSCPVILTSLYVQASVNETSVYVEYLLKNRTGTQAELMHMIQFATDAIDIAANFDYQSTYAHEPPWVDGTRARLVEEEVDYAQRKWAVDVICHESIAGFIWLGLGTGRAYSGLLRDDRDNIAPFAYRQ